MNSAERSHPRIIEYESATHGLAGFARPAKWIYRFAPALIVAAITASVLAGIILGTGKGEPGIIMVLPVYFLAPLYVVVRVLRHPSNTLTRRLLGVLGIACVLLAPFVLSKDPAQHYSAAWLVMHFGWNSAWVTDGDRARIIVLAAAVAAFALVRIVDVAVPLRRDLASNRARPKIDGGAL